MPLEGGRERRANLAIPQPPQDLDRPIFAQRADRSRPNSQDSPRTGRLKSTAWRRAWHAGRLKDRRVVEFQLTNLDWQTRRATLLPSPRRFCHRRPSVQHFDLHRRIMLGSPQDRMVVWGLRMKSRSSLNLRLNRVPVCLIARSCSMLARLRQLSCSRGSPQRPKATSTRWSGDSPWQTHLF